MRLLTTGPGEVLALAFSPDASALAAAIDRQGVYLWNLATDGKPVVLDIDTTARARSLGFAPDGRSVGWLAWNRWKVYDRDARELVRNPSGNLGPLLSLILTPDGSRAIAQTGNFQDPALVGWTVRPDEWVPDWSVSIRELSIRHRGLAVDPAGERVAVVCQPTRQSTRSARWWEEHPVRIDLRSAISGTIQATGSYPYQWLNGLTFAPDGSQLVAIHEMTLLVWPVPELGEPRLVRNDTRKHFTAACYHPSGRYLIVTSNDTTVHVFDTRTWERVIRFTWKLGQLRVVAVSPDGTLAAAGSVNGEIVVWDLDF